MIACMENFTSSYFKVKVKCVLCITIAHVITARQQKGTFMSLLIRFLQRKFTIIALMALLFTLASQFAPTASAHSLTSKANQPTSCLQAPASLDPRTLSENQLEAYGLPLRPL